MAKTITKEPFSGKIGDIRILDRLEELLPPLDADQAKALEESLVEEGEAYDALWMWGDILVDGHNRYRLCRKNNLPFTTKQVFATAKSIEDVEYRMKRLAIGQRNMAKQVCSRYRAENVLYLVEKKSLGKAEAIKEVAKEAEVSERAIYRDLERAEKIRAMAESVQHSAAINELSSREIDMMGLLSHAEQNSAVERAGHDADKLSNELKRMSKVEGSKLYNAEQAEKKKAAKAKRDEHAKKGLFALFQDQLGDASKTMAAIKREFKIKAGTYNRIYDMITKVDVAVADWKKASESSDSEGEVG